jgi:hypothetical protein
VLPHEEHKFWVMVGKEWLEYWLKNPDQEHRIFNYLTTPVSLLSHIYIRLVILKKIKPLDQLDTELKKELKQEVFRIDKNCTEKRGMQIAKSIYVLGYLSNI